ncbi:MAG: hypothetical protein H0X51_10140 [Parachlamydiaceae bacterium]|nr:hypothetical protein [Tatlockia sp.]MBA3958735.1 hypothetical protein [Parachlamydiaceae bacterium]
MEKPEKYKIKSDEIKPCYRSPNRVFRPDLDHPYQEKHWDHKTPDGFKVRIFFGEKSNEKIEKI